MLELPEAAVIAGQINENFNGRRIESVQAAFSPNKFAWYNGDPANYNMQLCGKLVEKAVYHGGMVQVQLQDKMLLFSDGVKLTSHPDESTLPKKHQLLIRFDDSSFMTAVIQMYGGIICAGRDNYDSEYYAAACNKPAPLSEDFTLEYFESITAAPELSNKSVKFVIATEQRIPGLGNGVLQDILYKACIHPKRKWASLSTAEKEALFKAVRGTMREIINRGGRDTEKDLLGNPGGYRTKMSKNTVGGKCEICGNIIEKASYMGGSIYFCSGCQKL